MATLYAYSPNGTQATLSYSVIGFTQSLQQNGWCKLPNGLILQWRLDTLSGQTATLSFPISFTTIVYTIILQNTYPYVNGTSAGWFSSNVLNYSLGNIKIYYSDKND